MAKLALCFTLMVLMFTLSEASVVGRQAGEVIKKVTGSLFAVDSVTGVHERLRRSDVDNADEHRHIRLQLGPDGQTIDMALRQRSVWTEDSKVIARRGDEAEEVPVNIRTACYLRGRVTSDDGVASMNYCDGLTGVILTRDVDYLLEELEPSDDIETEFREIAVTLLTPSNDLLAFEGDDEIVMEHEEQERIFFENMTESDDNNTDIGYEVMSKRQSGCNTNTGGSSSSSQSSGSSSGIAAEVGVYIDRYFANYLKSQKINTDRKVTNFMINKWNTVAEVYGNKAKVGINFDIQLKLIEVWWKNPSYYERIQADDSMSTHLRTFCGGTKNTRLDHRMLYTINVGGNVMGLAYVNGICNDNSACSAVKSKTSSVRVELHEFGHSLGFGHEPKLQPCSKPDGFMGWANTYKFNDCYKRVLLQNIKSNSKRCLYVKNLSKPVLN